MISLRLSPEIEKKLSRIARLEKITKSELMKRALLMYFKTYQEKKSPFDLGKDLFGKYGSGKGNLSRDYKRILKEKLSKKHTN